MRISGTGALVAIIVVLLATASMSAVAASRPSPSRRQAASLSASSSGSPARGVVRRVGRWLVDPDGRVVVVHGFNVVQKRPPYVPTEFGLRDAALLAREGFTVVRLPFLWAGVEPSPGHYDDGYIRRILRVASLLGRYGIRSLVDFHQDGWSSPAVPGVGDGAPAWADLGANTNDDFAAFWRNAPGPGGVGIQTRFLLAWHHVAAALRGDPDIIGIDPFNEPYPGSAYPAPCGPFTGCPQFERGVLPGFYRRVTREIRSAGARQVIFPEGVADNAQQPPLLPKLPDRQTAFNFHFYCSLTLASGLQVPVNAPSPQARACAPIERRKLGTYVRYARHLGVPGFLSEFSASDVNPDNAQIVDLVGRSFTSWTAWAYYPKEIGSDAPQQGLLRRYGDPATVRQDKLDAFAVPYATAIAGSPISTSLNRPNRTYRLSYRSVGVPGVHLSAAASTVVFVPAHMYPHGYVVHVHDARVTSSANARWLLLAAVPRRTVSLSVAPR